MAAKQTKNLQSPSQEYSKFKHIQGDHPFKTAVPGAYVDYRARIRHGGKLMFFNFALAKEMGLIPTDHPEIMNKKLKKSILDAFSLVIINEYDEANNLKFPKKDLKSGKYMATRYLQLQHPSSLGETSGDGRSVWNGKVTHKGVTWDISSCGTGATRLSPAAAKFKKFFQTGDPSVSYGCGYSEVDEGLSTAFFSEVLHKNQIPTERVLAVIEFEKNLSINVRAYKNLIRPSHIFNHLKQGNLERLTQVVNYYIDRQVNNGVWKNCPKSEKARYDYFLRKVTYEFAQITARFEDEYIFCWFDWDGDNILMDGGIIDYGSIRQFGLFHAEYRYDDDDRYSTSIVEQKNKSRYIVQTFVQMVEYLKSGKKTPIDSFRNHSTLKEFNRIFEECKDKNILAKIGFNSKQIETLLNKHFAIVQEFRHVFAYFERSQSKRGIYKVSDGITQDAIFCMRDILRELPQILLLKYEPLSNTEFQEIIKSSYASRRDLKITRQRAKRIQEFQKLYMHLIDVLSKTSDHSRDQLLLEITMRSSIINKYDRITGDSIGHITDRVLKARRGLTETEIYEILQEFVSYQNLDPDKTRKEKRSTSKHEKLLKSFFKIVAVHREGI